LHGLSNNLKNVARTLTAGLSAVSGLGGDSLLNRQRGVKPPLGLHGLYNNLKDVTRTLTAGLSAVSGLGGDSLLNRQRGLKPQLGFTTFLKIKSKIT
jgi:uncharacterized protein YjgD (DUF1641 family)